MSDNGAKKIDNASRMHDAKLLAESADTDHPENNIHTMCKAVRERRLRASGGVLDVYFACGWDPEKI